jgi:LacI family transcriptional regulator
VVGYDDHQLAVLVDPGLTTLGWDEDAMVASAVGQLEQGVPRPALFRPELIVRGSTSAPAAG